MPITIQPATLKVKKQNGQYQSADCLKGDKGDPGSVGIIAPDYADLTFPVAQGQPCIHEGLYYIANSAIQSSESWTAAHWTQLTVGVQVTDVLTAIQGVEVIDDLLIDEIPGTSKVVVFDNNGNPSTVTHSANGNTVRTDIFTWTTGSVTEVRTLASGKYITIVTNLETLAQTVSEVQEVA